MTPLVWRRRLLEVLSQLQLLRDALDAVDVGVVVTDADGQEVFRNKVAAEQLSDRSAGPLVGESLRAGFGAVAAGREYHRQLDLWGPPRRTLAVDARPFEAEGPPRGCLAVVRDISSQKHVDAVRRDFVSNVGHELRTPIGGLLSLLDALDADSDPAVARRLLQRARSEAVRAAGMVDDLLDLGRIEAAAGGGDFRELHLVDVIAAALDRVAALASARSISIEVTAVEDVAVKGDRSQLVPAVANLLDNAAKYSDPGQKVEISVHRIDGFAEVVVADQGIGIPPRELSRIFERFYRVDRARSRQTGGNGLGLSIARHAAINHGGDIVVDSREAHGSTFTLRLPIADGRDD